MQNILGRKLISCELLLRLYFKLKNNNIRTNRFWVQKSFMERKESSIFWYLKLFDHEFLSSSSTLLVFIFIFYSDVSQCLFCFLLVAFSNSLADNTREYFFPFSTSKWKKIPVQGKEIILFLEGALAQS